LWVANAVRYGTAKGEWFLNVVSVDLGIVLAIGCTTKRPPDGRTSIR
jgi:hypothetical protein